MANLVQDLREYGHEDVHFFNDPETGLIAIIGIHSTVLGPALGGCRMYPYPSDDDAIFDVLRLSRGMTYKASLAGLNLGGGKAVIIGDPYTQKTPPLIVSFARKVEGLGGRYITAEDSGTSVADIDLMRTQTRFAMGGSNAGGSGDPSPWTALGTFEGMKAAVKAAGLGTLKGLTVAVQGAGGHVGFPLCRLLSAAGAKLIISDMKKESLGLVLSEMAAKVVAPQKIYSVKCDVFSPNAMGAILTPKTIPQLKCKVVAGAANNQLLTPATDGQALVERGIIYAPDYALNAGGLISVARETDGYDAKTMRAKVLNIGNTITRILELAAAEGILPHVASDRLAEERIAAARK